MTRRGSLTTRERALRAVAEDEVERAIVDAIKSLPPAYAVLRNHTHRSEHSPAGWPDDTLGSLRTGLLIHRENKRAGKKPTPAQQAWMRMLAMATPDIGTGPRRVPGVDVWTSADILNGRITREIAIVAGLQPVPA